tara:strand:+ start:122 stop:502 length:381 start_codon:yes stop_codon:yes gene_type:complete
MYNITMTKMNSSSYEKYLIDQLESISKNFSVKTYKLANQEEWGGFERGKDIRVQIRWKNDCIWEWILEKPFWYQRNTNKDDRTYMRLHADTKINACKNAIVRKPIDKTKIKNEVGFTQSLFEKMKK